MSRVAEWGARNAPALAFSLPILAVVCAWVFGPRLGDLGVTDYVEFYEPVARRLIAGYGLAREDGRPAIAYPPGFPVILAGLFGGAQLLQVRESQVVSLFLLLCSGASGLALYAAGRIVWRPLAALVPAAVWAVYPPALWLASLANVELPFTPLVLTIVWVGGRLLSARSGRVWGYLGLGGLIGAVMLIRPIAIGLGVLAAIVVGVGLRRVRLGRRVALAACVLLGNVAVVAPWEAWMASRTGRIFPLSTIGVAGLRDGLAFGVDPNKPYRAGIPLSRDVRALMQRAHERHPQSVGDVAGFLAGEFTQRPIVVGQFLLLKAGRVWYGTDSQRFESVLLAVQVVFVGLGAAGAVLAARAGGPVGWLTCGAWIVIVYFWAMAMTVLPIARYMTPVAGLAFLPLPLLVPSSWLGLRREE
jgi:hypothetical protein